MEKSPCCDARIYASLGDGVMMGTCEQCNEVVVRINPNTSEIEAPTKSERPTGWPWTAP